VVGIFIMELKVSFLKECILVHQKRTELARALCWQKKRIKIKGIFICILYNMMFVVLMGAAVEITVFWDVISCSLLEVD
jgi:hypothetical protein